MIKVEWPYRCLTEGIIQINELYKRREIQNEQRSRNAPIKFYSF